MQRHKSWQTSLSISTTWWNIQQRICGAAVSSHNFFVSSTSLCPVSGLVYCSLSVTPRMGYRRVQNELLYKEAQLTQSSANAAVTWGKRKKSQTTCMSANLCGWVTTCLHPRQSGDVNSQSAGLDWMTRQGEPVILSCSKYWSYCQTTHQWVHTAPRTDPNVLNWMNADIQSDSQCHTFSKPAYLFSFHFKPALIPCPFFVHVARFRNNQF